MDHIMLPTNYRHTINKTVDNQLAGNSSLLVMDRRISGQGGFFLPADMRISSGCNFEMDRRSSDKSHFECCY